MKPILGKNVLFQVFDGVSYTAYACAAECSIDTTTELKSVKTIGDGNWGKYKAQKNDYQVSLSGVIILDASPAAFDLINYQIQGLDVPYQMFFEDTDSGIIRIIRGNILLNDSRLGGGSEGFASSEFSFQGNGAYRILEASTACAASIGSVTIEVFEPVTHEWLVSYSGTSDTVRIDYTIDAGAALSVFPSGDSGAFIVHLPATGVHHVVLTPYCDNGESGTPVDTTVITTPSIPGKVIPVLPNTICGGSPTMLYGDASLGSTLYTDAALTIPVTGYNIIISYDAIYDLNPTTGVRGGQTGSCTAPITSRPYILDTSYPGICSTGILIRLYGATFAPGVTLYTDAGLTTPVTGYTFIQAGISVFAIDSSTGVIGSYVGDCTVYTPNDYVLGNIPSICTGTIATYYIPTGSFDVGSIIYTNPILTTRLTGYSKFVLATGINPIYNINLGTGAVLSDSGDTCP